jgi:hypothetical protein
MLVLMGGQDVVQDEWELKDYSMLVAEMDAREKFGKKPVVVSLKFQEVTPLV